MLGATIESVIRAFRGKIWTKFVIQDRTKGVGSGYALSLCRDLVDGPILVYLPDEWHKDEKFSCSVTREREKYEGVDVAVATTRFSDSEEIARIGNIGFNKETGIVTKYLVKPNITEWCPTGVWAVFNITKFFRHLDTLIHRHKKKELHMVTVFQNMVNRGFKFFAFKEESSKHYHFTNIDDVRIPP